MIPFDSLLLASTTSTDAMRRIWSESALVERWLEVERAVTLEQSAAGVVPADAAAAIESHLATEGLPLDLVRRHAEASGHLMVGLLRAFRERCGDAAEHFHLGPTTQDILDTGLTLQMREADDLLATSLHDLERELLRRAREHRDTPKIARTHEQHALPTTFGHELALWAWEVRSHRDRARQARERWCFGSLSGGVGTHASFAELTDLEAARALERRVCARLSLPAPPADLHIQFHRFAEVVSNLALLTGGLGRMALELRGLLRPEISEIELPRASGACHSSTMPNKRNPEALEQVAGLAQLVRGHAAAMMAVAAAGHRDGTRLPTLYTALPQSFAMSHRATETLLQAVSVLRARPERMLQNLSHRETWGATLSERLMLALYRRTGRKHWAHTLLAECADRSRQERRPLRDLLAGQPEVREVLSADELERLLEPRTYLGTASAQVDDLLQLLGDA